MGDDFNKLSPLLRDVHTGVKELEGTIFVKHGGRFANLICTVFGFPKENPRTHLIVKCSHFNDRMEWVRYFDDFKMASTFVTETPYLLEKLGPLSMSFVAINSNGCLEYQFSRTKLFLMTSLISSKLQMSLTTRSFAVAVTAKKGTDAGTISFSSLIFKYAGLKS